MAENRDQWTIKGWPYNEREFVIRSARQADLSVAEWLLQAARNEASRQASQQVIPPGKAEEAPSIDVSPGLPDQPRESDWGGLAAVLEQAIKAEQLGLRGARGARAAAMALFKQRIRAGLPKRKQVSPLGISGPTIDG